MHFKKKNTQHNKNHADTFDFFPFIIRLKMETKFHSDEKSKKLNKQPPKHKSTYKNTITTTNKQTQQHKSVFKYIHSNKPQTGAGATNKTVQRVKIKHVLGIYQETKLFHLCSNRVGHTLSLTAGRGGTGAGRQNVRYDQHTMTSTACPLFVRGWGNNPYCKSPS